MAQHYLRRCPRRPGLRAKRRRPARRRTSVKELQTPSAPWSGTTKSPTSALCYSASQGGGLGRASQNSAAPPAVSPPAVSPPAVGCELTSISSFRRAGAGLYSGSSTSLRTHTHTHTHTHSQLVWRVWVCNV